MQYKKYARTKFRNWKERVAKHLPNFVIRFYRVKQGNMQYIPYEKEALLGRVIHAIHNPYYSGFDESHKPLTYESEIAMEILLELQVNELFAYIKTLRLTEEQ